ncbi:PHP domain-containing protein [Anoxybacterium hadale]|uniref:PHP domain-containing protein n=1 Tax=Anoxybacterium hadale TaxID=3408580 RepID=A0ACD1ABV7_9FIRM|nr:PHP domain-containing protein [Clostridiales bacterium]
MIDLHLHTYYSDGTMSPEALVLLAKENGVRTIAITDHDGMGGLKEGIDAGKRHGIHVIHGVELSTEDDEKIYMHILGYGFDLNNAEMNEEIECIRQKRVERNEKLLSALNEIGCNLTMEDLQLRSGQDYIGKPTFALALLRKGYISSYGDAYAEGQFMRSETVRRVHREKISAEKAIKLIRGAGGVPVLAHPMKIARLVKNENETFWDGLDKQLAKLKGLGLLGMECYYSSHTPEETKQLVSLAEKYELITTAGSDFHGTEYESGIRIGGFYTDAKFDENKMASEIQNGIY